MAILFIQYLAIDNNDICPKHKKLTKVGLIPICQSGEISPNLSRLPMKTMKLLKRNQKIVSKKWKSFMVFVWLFSNLVRAINGAIQKTCHHFAVTTHCSKTILEMFKTTFESSKNVSSWMEWAKWMNKRNNSDGYKSSIQKKSCLCIYGCKMYLGVSLWN